MEDVRDFTIFRCLIANHPGHISPGPCQEGLDGAVAAAGGLGEGLRSDGGGGGILDGDGLHDSGVTQGEWLAVELTLSAGGRTIEGVADFSTIRARDAHLRALSEGRFATNGRSLQRWSHGTRIYGITGIRRIRVRSAWV